MQLFCKTSNWVQISQKYKIQKLTTKMQTSQSSENTKIYFYVFCRSKYITFFWTFTCSICCSLLDFIFPDVATKLWISDRYWSSCFSLILGGSHVGSYKEASLNDSRATLNSSSYFNVWINQKWNDTTSYIITMNNGNFVSTHNSFVVMQIGCTFCNDIFFLKIHAACRILKFLYESMDILYTPNSVHHK